MEDADVVEHYPTTFSGGKEGGFSLWDQVRQPLVLPFLLFSSVSFVKAGTA